MSSQEASAAATTDPKPDETTPTTPEQQQQEEEEEEEEEEAAAGEGGAPAAAKEVKLITFDEVEGEAEDLSGDGGVLKKVITAAPADAESPPDGKQVSVHYVGTFTDEPTKKFDSSRARGQPLSFVLGQGSVVKGWEIGIGKLKVGERAILRLRSDYGYGDKGSGDVIPGGASLDFDVELLAFNDPPVRRHPLVVLNERLEAIKEKHGENHPDVAMCLHHLGVMSLRLRDAALAVKYFEQALKIRIALNGGGEDAADEHIITTLAALATVFEGAGVEDKALAYHNRGLALRFKLHGGESAQHDDLVTAMTQLAWVHTKASRFEEARSLHFKALAMAKALHGGADSDHPAVFSCLSNLGRLAHEEKNFEKARDYYRQTYELKVRHYGGEPREEVAGTLNSLGNVCYRQHDLISAEKYLKEAYLMQLKITPTKENAEQHKKTLESMRKNLNSVRQLQTQKSWQLKMKRYAKLKRERDAAKSKAPQFALPQADASLEDREQLAEQALAELMAMEGTQGSKKSATANAHKSKNKKKKKKK